MSSRSHQTYTRRWAKKCGAAVFSVDYRKAPEAPYPLGLADCWQVYNWLLNESHKFFKIKEKKRIILTGDSAGGNLSFALVNLCIENNVQKPY
jgi:hormone-sensitive lipase